MLRFALTGSGDPLSVRAGLVRGRYGTCVEQEKAARRAQILPTAGFSALNDSENITPAPELSTVDRWALKLWRWYKSIAFGMVLLAAICAICIYGTMHYAANTTLGDNAIPLAKARVFNAWWFFALLGFFFIQFVISTWHVTKMSVGIWWKRDFTRTRSFMTVRRPGRASISLPEGPDVLMRRLRGRFTRVHREGHRFFAHKGLQTRIGPTVIHAGIVVILLAGLARILLDRSGNILSEGRFVAGEGETRSTIFRPIFNDQAISGGNVTSFEIPFDVTVLDFDEVLHPNSDAPAYFSSLLKIRDWRTGETTVAKVDMNHSIEIGGYEFHQASYVRLPPIQTWRTNYDVRDAATGERIAVTDASPETRVQVGDEDLFLEVDGELPGAEWRLYTSESPSKPIDSGILLQKAGTQELKISVLHIFPDFGFDEKGGPFSRSSEPVNVALRVAVLIDDMPAGQTLVFLDEPLNEAMPLVANRFRIRLEDIRVIGGNRESYDEVDWDDPAFSRLLLSVRDEASGETLGETLATLDEPTEALAFASSEADEVPAAGATHAVYAMGRTIRHETVLSVVKEPIVPYYMAGVVLIGFGALMTFSGRYRALYAMWDEEQKLLHLAYIPRFGNGPDPKEFEKLLCDLSGGRTVSPDGVPASDPQPVGAG